MKKIIFTLFSFTLLYLNSSAQYCGHLGNPSGGSQCAISGTLTKPGLDPVSDSLPVVVNGVVSSTVIQFLNFDTIRFAGNLLTVQSLRIDSIGNLPTGLCWATDQADNTYLNQEEGCIKVNGTTCSTPGQYRLKIIVTACVGPSLALCAPIQTDAGAAGLFYYVRVKNSGATDTPVDTTGQSANTNIFVPYGPAADCSNGINDLANSINSLNIVPNPLTTKAEVSFVSDKSGNMTERITNMIGAEVFSKGIEVKVGENKSIIEKGDLPTGVYFYSISDGKNLVTKRVVVSE
jgi:hypothetical protein